MRRQRGGALPVNPSGGVLTHNPVFCTGLIRIAEVANQVRGRSGGHQVDNVRCGLAHAASGFAMQYQAAIVLGHEQVCEGSPFAISALRCLSSLPCSRSADS